MRNRLQQGQAQARGGDGHTRQVKYDMERPRGLLDVAGHLLVAGLASPRWKFLPARANRSPALCGRWNDGKYFSALGHLGLFVGLVLRRWVMQQPTMDIMDGR